MESGLLTNNIHEENNRIVRWRLSNYLPNCPDENFSVDGIMRVVVL
jgi:hypothetical protein